MISFRLFHINQAGDWRDAGDARQNLERKLCDFGAFLSLLQHLFDEAIDVDACGVEEVDAVMFFGA